MILLDTNVVLAVHRDDHVFHARVRPWFDDLRTGDEQFSVPDVVWPSFARIATRPGVFVLPSAMSDVFAFVNAVRAQASHVSITPGERHLALFEDLCLRFDVAGDLVPDAYLAALAIEQGATIASFDRDFARFDDLDWFVPGV